METATTSAFLGGLPIEVEPTAIDRVLTALWKPATEESEDGRGVTRLALGTLVVVADEEQAATVEAVCRQVAASYPSRVVVFLAGPRADLTAAVFATCQRAPGGGPQVCGETIVLRGGEAHLARLDGLILPLLLPDVLATLWWARPRQPRDEAGLLPLVDRGLTCLRDSVDPDGWWRFLARWPHLADLGWFAQHVWREAVAQLFDGMGPLPELDSIEVVATAADPRPTVAAATFAGWMAGQLGWTPATHRSARHTRWTRPDGSEASVLLTSLPGTGQPAGELWAATVSSVSSAGQWRVTRSSDEPDALRLTAHCADWCQLPGRLALPPNEPARCLLSALERPPANPQRSRAANHAAWLLSG